MDEYKNRNRGRRRGAVGLSVAIWIALQFNIQHWLAFAEGMPLTELLESVRRVKVRTNCLANGIMDIILVYPREVFRLPL